MGILLEGDNEFLKDASRNLVESSYPGMADRLIALRDAELGRALYVTREEDGEVERLIPAGYVLPLNKSQTRHIVVLRNGEIFETAPKNRKTSEKYKDEMSPTSSGVQFFNVETQVDDLVARIDNSVFLGSRVVLKGDSPENIEELNARLEKAIRLAIEIKRKEPNKFPKRKVTEEDRDLMRLSGKKIIHTLDELEAIMAPDSLQSKAKAVSQEITVVEPDDIPYGNE